MSLPSEIGTPNRPLRVGIVGAGPAGFHTAMALLDQEELAVAVDVLDRLPTPYGLVRAGVAPDHPKIKTVTRVYERLGSDPRFRFFGNVELGRDVTVEDLSNCYDQVVFATGNEADRRLGIPGEHLVGCVPATVFVGWYNGHPDYHDAKFGLDSERVVVIGNGNVALDVARILLKPPASLAITDIAAHALRALKQSRVREVIVLGRRGPMQASFAPAELKEITEIPGVAVRVDASDFELDAAATTELTEASPKAAPRRNYEILARFADQPILEAERTLEFRFASSPLEFLGDDNGQLRGLRVGQNRLVRDHAGEVKALPTGEEYFIESGFVLVSVGTESRRIPGIPFDEKRRCIANIDGRVVDGSGEWLRNQYCVGWARTGAQGLIAAQKSGAIDLVARMLEDFRSGTIAQAKVIDGDSIPALLQQRGLRWVGFEDWRIIDRTEVERGAARGAPRDKFVEVPAMIDLVEMRRRGW